MTDSSAAGIVPGAWSIARGDSRHGITISAEARIMRVAVYGDPPGDALVDCFRAAAESGRVGTDMATLVDLSRFDGKVDWKAIAAIGELAPWGDDKTRRSTVAYLTDSLWFGAVLKMVAVLYPRSAHRQFQDEASALAWLAAQRAAE